MSEWNRWRVALLVVLAIGCGVPETVYARVLLVGIDGASWNVIEPMLSTGKLPNLKRLMEEGLSADLETVRPLISPAVWTSIATGRTPPEHGVDDFLTTHDGIAVPSVWERLAVQGLSVGLYDYLVTWPPPRLGSGFVIPGWLRRDAALYPPDVWAPIDAEPYVYSVEGLHGRDAYLQNARQEPRRKADRFVQLLRAYDPDVAAVSFYAVDAVSHRYWRDSFPDGESNGSDMNGEGEVQKIVSRVDAALGTVLAERHAGDSIIVVSDHGFKKGSGQELDLWHISLEAEARRFGLDPTRDGFESEGLGFILVRIERGVFEERETIREHWMELLESVRSEDGTRLLGVEYVDGPGAWDEVSRPIWVRLRQWLVRSYVNLLLESYVDLDRDSHAYIFAWPQKKTLESLWPNGRVRVGERLVPMRTIFEKDSFSGVHDPTAVLIAAGGPIRHLAPRQRVSVLDIAPLLLFLAGSDLPDDLQGRPPLAWIDPLYLRENPVNHVAAEGLPRLRSPVTETSELEQADDQAIVRRLRGLGYVR